MAITNEFSIRLVDFNGITILTSITTGFSTSMSVPYGQIGSSSLTLTLTNQDGALTPNGGGTYQSVDWFAKALIIEAVCADSATANTVGFVFAGLITDFVLEDDGSESIVTITAVDALSKLTQSAPVTLPIVPKVTTYFAITQNMSLLTGWDPDESAFPLLSASIVEPFFVDQATAPSEADYIESASPIVYNSITDLLSNGILNSHNAVLFPVGISFTATGVEYGVTYLSSSKTRDPANAYTFNFQSALPLTFGTLTFTALDLAFELPKVINTVTATGSFAGADEQRSQNYASQQKYGMRLLGMGQVLSVLKNVIMDRSASTALSAQGEVEDVLSRCRENSNRHGTSSFFPQSISFSFKQLVANGVESTASTDGSITSWINIMNPASCFWQRLNLTWTGTGAVSQTQSCMIVGRTIEASLFDTVVTLELDPYFKNHSFQIGSDRLGEAKVA